MLVGSCYHLLWRRLVLYEIVSSEYCGKKSGVRKNLMIFRKMIFWWNVSIRLSFVHTILKLSAALAASVATEERNLSSSRRMKTYLKNSTSESMLNELALLSIRRDMPVWTRMFFKVLQETYFVITVKLVGRYVHFYK